MQKSYDTLPLSVRLVLSRQWFVNSTSIPRESAWKRLCLFIWFCWAQLFLMPQFDDGVLDASSQWVDRLRVLTSSRCLLSLPVGYGGVINEQLIDYGCWFVWWQGQKTQVLWCSRFYIICWVGCQNCGVGEACTSPDRLDVIKCVDHSKSSVGRFHFDHCEGGH